jgi:hypothetical protein
MIREMFRRRYPQRCETEVEVEATALAWHFTEKRVGAFEREGQAAETMLEEEVVAASKKAATIIMR